MRELTKSVVITGSSSGIGLASVLQMSRAGWQVFATVRKPEDGESLKSEGLPGITPVLMDVEDRSSILAAAAQVRSQWHSGLNGLVNVAGIGMVRPLEYASARDIQKIFDINVFGQLAVTQAFLPPLRTAHGRIVNVTSVGAHIAIPFGGPLNASKSAFGMLSDTLRLELHPFGIRVSTIEPGSIATPAVEKTLGDIEAVIQSLPELGRMQYAKMLRSLTSRANASMKGSSPDVVAQAVHHALTSDRPHIRYRVGNHARLLTLLPRILPDWLLDALRLRVFGLPTKFAALAAESARFTDRAA
jgi:NAD(P)-dependent dehydrogenase (short-subunit alcohol dehydrogenase family)